MTDEQRPISDAGQFMRMMAEFSDFGEWAIRAVASRAAVLPPMLATLRGRNGRVELSPRDGSLRAAIARACALAGIQPKLF